MQGTKLQRARVIRRAYQLKRIVDTFELERAHDGQGQLLMFDSGLSIEVGEETPFRFEGRELLVRLCWLVGVGTVTATGRYIRSNDIELLDGAGAKK